MSFSSSSSDTSPQRDPFPYIASIKSDGSHAVNNQVIEANNKSENEMDKFLSTNDEYAIAFLAAHPGRKPTPAMYWRWVHSLNEADAVRITHGFAHGFIRKPIDGDPDAFRAVEVKISNLHTFTGKPKGTGFLAKRSRRRKPKRRTRRPK